MIKNPVKREWLHSRDGNTQRLPIAKFKKKQLQWKKNYQINFSAIQSLKQLQKSGRKLSSIYNMPNYFLISLISNVFQIINILIIIRVLLSWFNYNANNQYIRLLYKITEPILSPIRNLLSSFNMGIDISPLIAIFALSFIRNLLIRLLVQIQFNLKFQPNLNPPRAL